MPESLDDSGLGSPINCSAQSKGCSIVLLDERVSRCQSVSLLSSKICSIQLVSSGSLYSDSGRRKKAKIDDGGDKTEGEDLPPREQGTRYQWCRKECYVEDNNVKEDFIIRILQVISDARFTGVKRNYCEVFVSATYK